jgi:putative peptide zinc metalloprotease protein
VSIIQAFLGSPTKVVLLVVSFAIFALLFSWQFAAILLVSIGFHESGHFWAMTRCRMKTKGMYFLPMLGAAAVADEKFPSRGVELFVALMGPVFGLILAALTIVGALITHNVTLAAAAGLMAYINVFNLIPVSILDGGRILKSIGFSISRRVGLTLMIGGLVGGALPVFFFNPIFAILIVYFGVQDFAYERGRKDDVPSSRKPITALYALDYCLIILAFGAIIAFI